jgi:hypothetical protein
MGGRGAGGGAIQVLTSQLGRTPPTCGTLCNPSKLLRSPSRHQLVDINQEISRQFLAPLWLAQPEQRDSAVLSRSHPNPLQFEVAKLELLEEAPGEGGLKQVSRTIVSEIGSFRFAIFHA